jgi:hypothetical protein
MQGLAQIRNPEDVSAVVEAARLAKKAQQTADDLKQQALAAVSPEDKQLLLADAERKEKEARKHSKKAHRLASGTWQGAVNGGSIGAAVGVGLGTVIGTLVGTIASIPTTGLGVLVGIPVGWLHGPWVKMDPGMGEKVRDESGKANEEGKGNEEDEGDGSESEMTDEETHRRVIDAVTVAEEQERELDETRNHTQHEDKEHDRDEKEMTAHQKDGDDLQLDEETGLQLQDPIPITEDT